MRTCLTSRRRSLPATLSRTASSAACKCSARCTRKGVNGPAIFPACRATSQTAASTSAPWARRRAARATVHAPRARLRRHHRPRLRRCAARARTRTLSRHRPTGSMPQGTLTKPSLCTTRPLRWLPAWRRTTQTGARAYLCAGSIWRAAQTAASSSTRRATDPPAPRPLRQRQRCAARARASSFRSILKPSRSSRRRFRPWRATWLRSASWRTNASKCSSSTSTSTSRRTRSLRASLAPPRQGSRRC
mmetsp:Transcript_6917/g.22436  ORF Transcript_6917/g.22436 Transcript_6917/m.22436 type:complete len:247 (+) Transcript_6917:256-996(+)